MRVTTLGNLLLVRIFKYNRKKENPIGSVFFDFSVTDCNRICRLLPNWFQTLGNELVNQIRPIDDLLPSTLHLGLFSLRYILFLRRRWKIRGCVTHHRSLRIVYLGPSDNSQSLRNNQTVSRRSRSIFVRGSYNRGN